jgi:uncharacterized membrane protein YdjX (TVP38/TMEM64 family)
MLPATRTEWLRLILGVSLLVALISVGVWLSISGYLQQFVAWLTHLLEDKHEMRLYLRSWGVWAPAVFVVLQALQVVFAPIPGELTGIAGGFIFGTWLAVVYSTVGLTLGSLGAFLAARVMGQPLVKLVVTQQTVEKFGFLTKPSGTVTTFILFMIPGFPKDMLCYLLGLSPMHFVTFAIVCGIGRIPGTMMLALSGAALYKENWRLIAILGAALLVLLVVCYLKSERIMSWIKEKSHLHS